ncbi:MAG TPA: CsbD family protein [Candidatus Nanopelagicales bacterium]|nr:CsbD family protein [Candidatus Nanopelagicales bacterium]
MSAEDKIKNMGEKAEGEIKKVAGELTDNDRLKAEGEMDKAKGDLKQSGEKLKDAVTE